jgi:RimJ/RimL family protein N-acetyltransferase
VLGGTGLHLAWSEGALEIGYWIHKDYINRGLVTESSAALTRVAFEVNRVNRVEIHCDPKNVRSAAVPPKLGYTHEATLLQRLKLDNGSWRDSMVWTLLAQNYPSSPPASRPIQAFDVIGRRII